MYNSVLTKEPSRGSSMKSTQGTTPIILQMPLQTVTRYALLNLTRVLVLTVADWLDPELASHSRSKSLSA